MNKIIDNIIIKTFCEIIIFYLVLYTIFLIGYAGGQKAIKEKFGNKYIYITFAYQEGVANECFTYNDKNLCKINDNILIDVISYKERID